MPDLEFEKYLVTTSEGNSSPIKKPFSKEDLSTSEQTSEVKEPMLFLLCNKVQSLKKFEKNLDKKVEDWYTSKVLNRGDGGIGRRAGLRILWPL